MNQTRYMATRDMLRILETKRYSHQKIYILSNYALFNIDENLHITQRNVSKMFQNFQLCT